MPADAKLLNPDLAIDVIITAQSDHVIAVKLWHRPPTNTTWTLFLDSGTGAGNSVRVSVGPLRRNSQIYYWLGISNPSAHEAPYEVDLALEQAGQALKVVKDSDPPSDALRFTGITGGGGNAVEEGWVNLL